jgi:hypothetical protein
LRIDCLQFKVLWLPVRHQNRGGYLP